MCSVGCGTGTTINELVERLLLEEPSMVLHICHKPNPALRDRYDGIYELSDGVLTPVYP